VNEIQSLIQGLSNKLALSLSARFQKTNKS